MHNYFKVEYQLHSNGFVLHICIYNGLSIYHRTIEENLQLASLPKSKQQYNVSRKPVFPTIPLDHVVIDNLHLFVRASDVLIDQLIMELLRLDAIDKARRVAGLDRMKHNHVAAFEEFVWSLGISVFPVSRR